MNLDKLYDIAEREKIHIKEMHLKNANGMYINYNDINVILLDKNIINKRVQELCTLAEEVGHYFHDACYPLSCVNKTTIDKNEYRATKWAFMQLINKEKLINLLKSGWNKWEVAEEFGVTVELLEKAREYYKNN